MVNGLVTRLCFDSSRKTSELSLKTCPDRNFVDNYRHPTKPVGAFYCEGGQRAVAPRAKSQARRVKFTPPPLCTPKAEVG